MGEQRGLCTGIPFSYRAGKRIADGVLVDVQRNLAKQRQPRPHTTIKYLEVDFAEALRPGTRGSGPGRRAGPAVSLTA